MNMITNASHPHPRRTTWSAARLENALALVLVLALSLNAVARAQDAAPPTDPATDPPPPTAAGQDDSAADEAEDDSDSPSSDENDDRQRSLDELLGLEEEAEANEGAADVHQQEMQEALERELGVRQVADAFVQALAKMRVSAQRLDESFDPGLGTQRVQEDVLAKLDELIEQAQKLPSDAMQQQQQQQQQQQNQQNPGEQQRQQQQQQQANAQPQSTPSGQAEDLPGQPQSPDPNQMLEEGRVEWGSLPERVRNELLQGRQEKFSSLYEQLTRRYYQRLAEEASRP